MSNIKNRQILKKDRLEKIGIFSSFLLFTVFSICLYSPVIRSHAADQSAEINIGIEETMSLTLDKSTLNINTDPGVFVSGTINAEVTTNSLFGYSLTLEDADSDTSMHHSDSNVSNAVTSSYEGTKTSSTMENNTWGYSLDSTEFSAIPAKDSAATLKTVNNLLEDGTDNVAVDFGIKTSRTLTAGTYTDQVVFTVFANGGGTSGCQPGDESFFCISSMQEMTPAVCEATVTPLATATEVSFENDGDNTKIPRTILTDSRDGTKYLVSKYADGRCWMSQNLELALSTSTTLTSDNTDLNTVSSWTPANNTATDMNTLESLTSCDGGWCNYYYPALKDASYLPTGTNKYKRNGTTPAATPSTDDGKSNWESTGIYYSWFAATAGSGIEPMTNGNNYSDVEDSICPKGWTIPDFNWDNDGTLNIFTQTYSDAGIELGVGETFGFVGTSFIYPKTNAGHSEDDPPTLARKEDYYEDTPYIWTNKLDDAYYNYASVYYFSSWSGYSNSDANGGAPVRCVARN